MGKRQNTLDRDLVIRHDSVGFSSFHHTLQLLLRGALTQVASIRLVQG